MKTFAAICLLMGVLAAAGAVPTPLEVLGEPVAVVNNVTDYFDSFVAAQPAPNNYCVAEHNRVRAQNGLPAFGADGRLAAAAGDHSSWMARNNCFSHQCPGEPSFGDRITARGYRWSGIAENIAAGQADCNAAVNSWMNSDGHRRNILGNYRHIGCSLVTCTGCTYGRYFTCNFGNPA